MRKKGRIALVILATAILGLMAWKVSYQPEPTYKGKSLTSWLECYTSGPEHLRPIVDEAVRSIGTNAIPALLERLRAPDPYPYSPLKLKWIGIAQKLKLLSKDYRIPNNSLGRYGSFRRPNAVQSQGICGFRALGGVGKDAVPQLIAIYEQNISESSQYSVASVLDTMDPHAQKAIPLFIRRTTHKDPQVRHIAVQTLGNFHIQPELVVPCLAMALYDPSTEVCLAAVQALRKFGTEAKLAVPALVDRITTFDKKMHLNLNLYMMDLLIQIHAEPKLVVPALIKVLNEGNKMDRHFVADVLRQYGKDAKPAVPALLEQLNASDSTLRSRSMKALKIIDPDALTNANVNP